MSNLWELALERLRPQIDDAEYRRWFLPASYAADSGDRITIWVPTETDRRHLQTHYQERIDRALQAIDRPEVHIRFVVAGYGEDEELEE